MNEMNWGFDEWSTIATIFLSVVAIVIAIWSSRGTSKDAEKQIREIKKLSALQIETSIKQLEVEIHKTMAKIMISAKESKEIDDINKFGAHLGSEYRNLAMRKFQESKSQTELEVYSNYTQRLNEILKGLKDLKKNIS